MLVAYTVWEAYSVLRRINNILVLNKALVQTFLPLLKMKWQKNTIRLQPFCQFKELSTMLSDINSWFYQYCIHYTIQTHLQTWVSSSSLMRPNFFDQTICFILHILIVKIIAILSFYFFPPPFYCKIKCIV
jgi:hypothetical protein